MPKVLCRRCMQSIREEDLAEYEGERLCPPCRAIAKKPHQPRPQTETNFNVSENEPPAETAGIVASIIQDAREWCKGRIWWVRLPVLMYLAYITVRYLSSEKYRSVFGGINLGIHEAGHYVFAFFGAFFTAAGGTILQCLAPLVAAGVFVKQRDYFGIAFSIGWLATNFYNVAPYVGDARAMRLPLVTPGGGPAKHDWNYLLGKMHLLEWDRTIAFLLRIAGTAVMAVALIIGAWLIWQMIKSSRSAERGNL